MRNFFRSKFIQTHLAIGALIALFAPLTVLDDLPLLASVTGLFKALFPPIAAYAAKSKFPQVSELYFAWMWLFSPWYFAYGLQQMKMDLAQIAPQTKHRKEWLKLSLGITLMTAGAIFVFLFNPGYDYKLLPINSSRPAMAFAGVFFSGAGAAYLLGGSVSFGRCVFNKIRQSFTVKE